MLITLFKAYVADKHGYVDFVNNKINNLTVCIQGFNNDALSDDI